MKAAYPDVTYPYYADNAGALRTNKSIKLYFNLLNNLDLVMGITRNPQSRVLIVHPDNIQTGKLFGLRYGFKVCTGAPYLGGFIRNDDSKQAWLLYCTSKGGK